MIGNIGRIFHFEANYMIIEIAGLILRFEGTFEGKIFHIEFLNRREMWYLGTKRHLVIKVTTGRSNAL